MKKRWVRILISLLVGGMLNEAITIKTGRDSSVFLFIGAIFSYIVLSATVYFQNIYSLQRKVDGELKKKGNDELLDSFEK